MRIRIQLFIVMRMWIQLPKIMRIRSQNPDFRLSALSFRKQDHILFFLFYEVVQPEVNEKDVETMVKMGFPRDQCIQELRYR